LRLSSIAVAISSKVIEGSFAVCNIHARQG